MWDLFSFGFFHSFSLIRWRFPVPPTPLFLFLFLMVPFVSVFELCCRAILFPWTPPDVVGQCLSFGVPFCWWLTLVQSSLFRCDLVLNWMVRENFSVRGAGFQVYVFFVFFWFAVSLVMFFVFGKENLFCFIDEASRPYGFIDEVFLCICNIIWIYP